MMRKFNYVVMLLVSMFLFSNIVDAKCSTEELRDEMLKSSEIKVDYEEVEELKQDPNGDPPEYYEYYLYVRIFNLPDNVDVKVTSLNSTFHPFNLTSKDKSDDGIIYVKDPTAQHIRRYQFSFTSSSAACYGETLKTLTLNTPMFNKYSLDGICEDNPDFKYCERFVNYDISGVTFKDVSSAYQKFLNGEDQKENAKEESKIKEVASKYWYVIVIILVLVAGGAVAYIVIKKKRSKII